jgi:rubrerythrin
MSFSYNADNIFEMAIEIERNGAKFYKDASDKISEQEIKELLISLNKMEIEHEDTFKDMRSKLKNDEKGITAFDPFNEESDYLRSLADTKVFFDKEIDLSSPREVLKRALTAEKDSILFYLGMKGFVPESMGKNWIDDIIEEEKKHITLLSSHLIKFK